MLQGVASEQDPMLQRLVLRHLGMPSCQLDPPLPGQRAGVRVCQCTARVARDMQSISALPPLPMPP